MKKIIVLVIVFLSVNALQAQGKPKSKSKDVTFGLKGGLNIANCNVTGDGSPSTKSLTNFHIGSFVEIKLNDKIAFQPELLYSVQGFKFDQVVDVEGDLYDTRNTLKFGYINIPLMMKYYPDAKFYLEAGPQIGFLTSANIEVSIPFVGSAEEDVKESFNSIDFGLNFGAGYDISDKVFLSLRYNLGLSNIADTEPGDNSKIKNSVFQISLGYKFN